MTIVNCLHPNAKVNEKLATFSCPDCGIVRRLSPTEVGRIQFVQSTLPYLHRWLPILEQYEWTGDEEDVLALLAFSIAHLRDVFKRDPKQIAYAVETFYTLANIAFGARDEHGGN